jgi:hypothetical protein
VRRLWWRLRDYRFQERDERAIPAETLAIIDICWSLTVGISFMDPLRGWTLQALHLSLALEAGEPYRVVRALALEAGHEASGGTPSRAHARHLTSRTVSLAERVGRPHARAVALMAEGFASYFDGAWDDARKSFDKAAALLTEHCTGVAWELNTSRVHALKSLFQSGAWGEVARRLPPLLQEAQLRDDRLLEQGLVEGFLYFEALIMGDPERARHLIRRGLVGPALRTLRIENFWLVSAEVDIALYCGEGTEALGLLAELWPTLERSQTRRVQQNRILALWSRARSALSVVAKPRRAEGDPESLLRLADADARAVLSENSRWGLVLGSLIEAGVQACRRQRDAALAALDRGETALDSAQMRGVVAATLRRRRGELLGGARGASERDAADASLRAEGIRDPERVADVYLPGVFAP